jgi:1,4-alpha-glucan branching enzyme
MPVPSDFAPPGPMGATILDQGVVFRTWAPFASAVSVAGTFNGWSRTAHPLAEEGNGFWSVEVPGAGAGDEYLLYVRNGEAELRRIDPYARNVSSSVGDAILMADAFDWGGDSSYRTPTLDRMVVYEMHVGTFNDDQGGATGNLHGVIAKLDHLFELGVNAIQVMPVAEFAGGYSWGYNPAHLFAIESDYGGPDSLKELVRAAHERGIAVIFDVVYNHFGPSDLDIWQFDGWSEHGGGGIYFYNDWRRRTPWGDTRPDYGRPEVRRYIRDNAMMWLEEYRGDGLRWDMTAYIRNVDGRDRDPGGDLPDGWSLMQWVHDEIKARFPWKVSIAEDMQDNPWLTRDTGAGGAGFDSQWDAPFVHCVRDAVITYDDADRDMNRLRDAIAHRYSGDAFERVIYTESHDEVANGRARVPHDICPDDPGSHAAKKRSMLGAAIVLTAPGVPMIFQGQEFLEDEWFHDTDPVDWDKKQRFAGVFAFYKDLIRLRRDLDGASAGLTGQHVNVHHVNDADKVIAYHRWRAGGPGDDVVVVVNMANRAFEHYVVGFPAKGRWRLRLNSDWRGYDPDFGDHWSGDVDAVPGGRDGLNCHAGLGIGAYTVLVFSQDRS